MSVMQSWLHRHELRKGIVQGIERVGLLEGMRLALRRVLEVRNLPLTADLEARVDGCSDLATLRSWLDAAIVAESAADALK